MTKGNSIPGNSIIEKITVGATRDAIIKITIKETRTMPG